MNFAPAGFAKKAKAAACLLCASFLFTGLSAYGEQAAPIGIQEAQIWEQYGFSPGDAAEWKHVGLDGHFSVAKAVKSWGKP